MRRWTTAALAIGLLATTGLGALADARGERGRDTLPGAEPRAGTIQIAGQVWETEPGPNGTVIETGGVVYVAAKSAKGVKCASFWIARTPTEATVTAFCTAPKGGGKRIASLQVWTAAFDGNIGYDPDSCRDRHDIRKNPVFECTVELPDDAP